MPNRECTCQESVHMPKGACTSQMESKDAKQRAHMLKGVRTSQTERTHVKWRVIMPNGVHACQTKSTLSRERHTHANHKTHLLEGVHTC